MLLLLSKYLTVLLYQSSCEWMACFVSIYWSSTSGDSRARGSHYGPTIWITDCTVAAVWCSTTYFSFLWVPGQVMQRNNEGNRYSSGSQTQKLCYLKKIATGHAGWETLAAESQTLGDFNVFIPLQTFFFWKVVCLPLSASSRFSGIFMEITCAYA